MSKVQLRLFLLFTVAVLAAVGWSSWPRQRAQPPWEAPAERATRPAQEDRVPSSRAADRRARAALVEQAARSHANGAELSALRAEVDELRSTLKSPAKGSDRESAPSLSPEEAAREERQQIHAILEGIERRFQSEAEDPQWAAEAKAVLSDALLIEGVRGHSQVDEVECAATLCRWRATHDSGAAALALVNQIGRSPLFGDSEAFSERFEREDGSLETITYLTRRGHALPRANPPAE